MTAYPRLLVAVIFLAACRPAPPPDAPATHLPPSAPPEAASRDLLTTDGWQGLRIGMTRQAVMAVLGDAANPGAMGGVDPAECDEFRPERAPDGMLLMLEEGRLTRISLRAPARVETEGGLAVGDSAADVTSHFGDRARVTPHKYEMAPARYLTVWTVAPPAPDAKGLVYEVGREGRVVRIHAGGPSVQYVEGCL